MHWRCYLTLIAAQVCLVGVCYAEKITYSELENGDTISVTLDQLLPTQAVLDYDAIYANLQRYKTDRKNIFNDLCRLNGRSGVKKWSEDSTPTDSASYQCKDKTTKHKTALSTVVIGPEEGVLYLTDKLTALSTFWDMPNGGTSVPITVKVAHNLLDSGDDFWAEMNNDHEVWLFNRKGEKIKPDDLPEYIGMKQLKNDKYLSVVNFLEGISYRPPKPDGKDNNTTTIPFLALNWALEIRKHMNISDYDLNDPEEYATALTEAATIMVDLADDTVIGNSKRTAKEMGKFDTVDSKALEALVTNKKSRFGLAIAYRLDKKEKSTPKAILDEEKQEKQEAKDKNKDKDKDKDNGENPPPSDDSPKENNH